MTEDLNNSNVSSGSSDFSDVEEGETDFKAPFEKDFYGCYCLKFRVKHGTSVTEHQIVKDFGAYGEVVKVWGAGVDEQTNLPDHPGQDGVTNGNASPRLDSVVCVWYYRQEEAEAALSGLCEVYHELTPAISDILLPDNFGTFSISFINKVSLPTEQIQEEFSKFGPIKKLNGFLNVRGGRVFITYDDKESATQAFIHKTERWFAFMRFEFPKCERDYTGCYCLKFYNNKGSDNFVTEDQVMRDFSKFGAVVDIRGPGLFDVQGNDVYVRYREKASAQAALSSLVGYYDSICITPASDIVQDSFGWYTLTFVNKNNLTDLEVRHTFQQFGQVTQVTGTWGSPTGRVFVAFLEKQGATSALQALVSSKDFRLQLARGSKPGKKSRQFWSPGHQNKRKMNVEQEMPAKRSRGAVLSSVNRGEEEWREEGLGMDQYRGEGEENYDPRDRYEGGRRDGIMGRRGRISNPREEYDEFQEYPQRKNYQVDNDHQDRRDEMRRRGPHTPSPPKKGEPNNDHQDYESPRPSYKDVGDSRYSYRERHLGRISNPREEYDEYQEYPQRKNYQVDNDHQDGRDEKRRRGPHTPSPPKKGEPNNDYQDYESPRPSYKDVGDSHYSYRERHFRTDFDEYHY